MSQPFTLAEIRARTCKQRDAWWTVLLVDPIAVRLLRVLANRRWVTPNRLTAVAFGLGLAAAACFATADPVWLIVGGLLFHLSFVADCLDGKLARLNGTGSLFGIWLDFIGDQVRVIICTAALMGGQFWATDDERYLWAAIGLLTADLLRYMSAWHMGKVRAAVRRRRRAELECLDDGAALTGRPGGDLVAALAAPISPETVLGALPAGRPAAAGRLQRVKALLARHRIRAHVISGVEFQMAAFVVGPITGAVVAVPAVTAVVMLGFEAVLAYQLFRSVAAYEREHPLAGTAREPRTLDLPVAA